MFRIGILRVELDAGGSAALSAKLDAKTIHPAEAAVIE
jgi:hypothetical protein